MSDRSIPMDCALCGGRPELETKKNGGVFFRLVCNNSKCVGHHGRYYLTCRSAFNVWDASQKAKRSTIQRFIKTELINHCPELIEQ